MSTETFYWHDFETSGADPARDRPLQFAGQRTDMQLNPVGEALVIYCKPALDQLPHPEAALITGITPQHALAHGLDEPGFAALIHEQLATPGTCGVGYNSLRFDDAVSRHLFYRNFFEPYAREWQHGNSRWDLIDLLRMAYALRPQGLQWPTHEPGVPSFRLEELSAANGLEHLDAHDALSDVRATIALAQRLREHQPRLWAHGLSMRNRHQARALLDTRAMTPLIHVSARYPARRGCLALVAPLCEHPQQRHAVIVVDLSQDPSALIELDAEDIIDRLYTPQQDLPEGVERIALKLVHCNHSPMLAPVATLKNVDLARIQLDTEACRRHLRMLRAAGEQLPAKLHEVYSRMPDETAPERDAELSLYSGGFLDDSDRQLLPQIRSAAGEALRELGERLQDARYRELLFRYRARHHPHTLDAEEQQHWQRYLRRRLLDDTELSGLSWAELQARSSELRQQHHADPDKLLLLDRVLAWGQQCVDAIDTL